MVVDNLNLSSSKVLKVITFIAAIALFVLLFILFPEQDEERIQTIILLIVYLLYFFLLEIPLHEKLHYWRARKLGFNAEVDLKWAILNRLWRINPNRPQQTKPNHPNVRVFGKQQFVQFILITVSPILILLLFLILFSLLFYIFWEQNIFSVIRVIAVAATFISFFVLLGDYLYIVFAIKNRIRHGVRIRFEDHGTRVTAEI